MDTSSVDVLQGTRPASFTHKQQDVIQINNSNISNVRVITFIFCIFVCV